MKKVIWPESTDSITMKGNLTSDIHGSLYLNTEDPNEPFWIAFGLSSHWESTNFYGNETIHIKGVFPKGTFVQAQLSKDLYKTRYPLPEGYVDITFPISELFDEDEEITAIKMIKIAGTTRQQIRIDLLAIGMNVDIKRDIYCITKPSWERGIWRSQEKEVCLLKDNIHFDKDVFKATAHDTIFIRPVDQNCTLEDYAYIKMLEDDARGEGCRIINSIDHLYKYKLKDLTIELWKKNSIPSINCEVISSFEQLEGVLKKYERVVLRLNNDASCGNSEVVHAEHERLQTIYDELVEAMYERINEGHIHTRIIASEKIPPFDNYHIVVRNYVVHERIFSTYAYVHKMSDNNRLQGGISTGDDYNDAFVNYNIEALAWSRKYSDVIIDSVKCLGLDTACVEYIMTPDGPVFLECNAFWGSGLQAVSWPHSVALKNYLTSNEESLITKIPNVYLRMNENKYWNTFYNLI